MPLIAPDDCARRERLRFERRMIRRRKSDGDVN
jgi:hypothetical protein